MRVAGVLTAQSGHWGISRKSLRRPRGTPKLIQIPFPSDEESVPKVVSLGPEPIIEPIEAIAEISMKSRKSPKFKLLKK